MKYEITKGSEKDFEGVPVWALYVETYRGNVFASEGYSAGDRYIALTGLDKGKEFIVDDETNPPGRIIAERRPITEQAWDGEGLPPVGVECEMHNDRGTWLPVDVIAHKDGFAFGWSYDYRIVLHSDKTEGFRPIRSPEDVARDEAIDAIFSILSVNILDGSDSNAGKVFDAIAAGKIPGVKLE